jgi:hypothetical protein
MKADHDFRRSILKALCGGTVEANFREYAVLRGHRVSGLKRVAQYFAPEDGTRFVVELLRATALVNNLLIVSV